MRQLWRKIPRPRPLFLIILLGTIAGFVIAYNFEQTRWNVVADLVGLFGFGLLLWFFLEERSEQYQDSAWLRRNAEYVVGAIELVHDHAAFGVEMALHAGYDFDESDNFNLYDLRLGRTRKKMEAGAAYAQRLLDAYNQDARRQAELHPAQREIMQSHVESIRQSLAEHGEIYSRRVNLSLLVKHWLAVSDSMLTPDETTREHRRRFNLDEPETMMAVYLKYQAEVALKICRECISIYKEIDAYPLPPL